MKPSMIRRHLLIAALALALPATAWAAGPLNLDGQGVAIKGHDPVAYFVDGKPMPGRAELSHSVGGATYWFANDRNLQAFKAEPAKYLPQYGGYCAYGVAQGFKPDIDPTAFRIVEGKLYLNLSPAVQTRWLADVPGFISRANENWSQLRNQ
jgi:YHS domain-containing protein